MATRRSPLESVLLKTNEEEEEQGGRSLFLRGWLTEAETAEVSLFPLISQNCILLSRAISPITITNLSGVGTLRGGRRHIARPCSCCGPHSSCKVSIFGSFSLFPVASDFYCPSTGCAMAAVPPQRQQPHCELRSRQTFVNIAVRHRGTGCTQRHMMRLTASHLLSTQKISGV